MSRLPSAAEAWLLSNASAPVRWRWLTEVALLPNSDPAVVAARQELHHFGPCEKVIAAQDPEGTWRRKLILFEAPNASRRRGPGMVSEFLFLVERGIDSTHPAVYGAIERLLVDLVPSCHGDLHELAGFVSRSDGGEDEVRDVLFRTACTLLARVGLGDDPRVAPHAMTLVERLIKQELGAIPATLIDGVETDAEGKSVARLRGGAMPPDHLTLDFLAWSPQVRRHPQGMALRRAMSKRLMSWTGLTELCVLSRGHPFLGLRIPRIATWTETDFSHGGIGFLLRDLDLLARMGTLLETPKALLLLERLLSGLDSTGMFQGDAWIEKHETPTLYPWFPLEDSWRGKHRRYTDVTLRIGMILRILDSAAKAI